MSKEKEYNDLKPIKEIAGEILLYFYYIQRQDLSSLKNLIVIFEIRNLEESESPSIQSQPSNTSIFQDLRKMVPDVYDTYNALKYLEEKSFLNFKENQDNKRNILFLFFLTSEGIDIIEGIERDEDAKKQFNVTFNIEVKNNIESLLKAQLGSILSLM